MNTYIFVFFDTRHMMPDWSLGNLLPGDLSTVNALAKDSPKGGCRPYGPL